MQRLNEDVHDQLKYIASNENTIIKNINLGDPYSDNNFIYECTFKKGQYRIKWSTNNSVYLIRIDGFKNTLYFCLGKRDPLRYYAIPHKIKYKNITLRILLHDNTINTMLHQWLCKDDNLKALSDLNLKKDEILQVFKGQIGIFVHPRGHEGNINLLKNIMILINKLYDEHDDERKLEPGKIRTAGGEYFNPDKLPSSLRNIASIIKEWSIGDDADRSEKINAASTRELEHFTNIINPLLNNIIKYSTTSYTDEASVLLWISEAAHEIELTLLKRKSANA